MKVYDYSHNTIVVGGGTSGLVLARRIARGADVLILESSKIKAMPPWYRVPLMIGLLFKSSNKFVKIIQFNGIGASKVPYFVSRVFGGSSVMNGAVHVFGSLDLWRSTLKKFNLKEDFLLESYRGIFSSSEPGKIFIKKAEAGKLENDFLSSVKEYFKVSFGDTSDSSKESCGSIVNTVGRFFRTSVAASLDIPSNVEIRLNSTVDNLVLNDQSEVIGVMSKGEVFLASKVILSGGVIGTNKLLLSEIYNLTQKKYAQPPWKAGNGIADHPNIRINVLSGKRLYSLNEVQKSFLLKTRFLMQYLLGKSNLLQGTGATAAANLSMNNSEFPNIRLNLLRFYEDSRTGGQLLGSTLPGFSLSISVVRPHSRGSVVFDEHGEANITPNYMLDDRDRELYREAIRSSVKLLQNGPLSKNVAEILNLDKIMENIDDYIDSNTYSGYHLIGGAHNLVDSDFKVLGVENLYICDASVLDDYPSSNIHSSVILLADMFARRFIQQNPTSSKLEKY